MVKPKSLLSAFLEANIIFPFYLFPIRLSPRNAFDCQIILVTQQECDKIRRNFFTLAKISFWPF